MARTYAKLLVEVWDDDDFKALTGAAQRLYFLMCSQRSLSTAGLIPIQPRKWARLASDTNADDIEIALLELAEARYVLVDEDTEEALIRTFIRHDGGARNRNLNKSIAAAIKRIDSDALSAHAAEQLAIESQKHQDTGSDEDPPPDPDGDRGEGDSEDHPPGDTEPTCHLSPDTFNQSVSPSDNFQAVVEHAVDRLEEAFPNKTGSLSYRQTLRNDVVANHADDIHRALRMYPDCTPQFHARNLDLGTNVA